MRKLIAKVKMENTKSGHNKQWTGELYDDDLVVTRWGPNNGWERSKPFKRAGEAFLIEKLWKKNLERNQHFSCVKPPYRPVEVLLQNNSAVPSLSARRQISTALRMGQG
jgi:hypothetical protein